MISSKAPDKESPVLIGAEDERRRQMHKRLVEVDGATDRDKVPNRISTNLRGCVNSPECFMLRPPWLSSAEFYHRHLNSRATEHRSAFSAATALIFNSERISPIHNILIKSSSFHNTFNSEHIISYISNLGWTSTKQRPGRNTFVKFYFRLGSRCWLRPTFFKNSSVSIQTHRYVTLFVEDMSRMLIPRKTGQDQRQLSFDCVRDDFFSFLSSAMTTHWTNGLPRRIEFNDSKI